MKRTLFFATIGLLITIAFSSCSKQEGENAFKVRMTDSPGNYAALNLTIIGVDAYLQNSGWVNLSSQTQFVNVLTLTNGSEVQLVNATSINAGIYTKLRIRFANQANVLVNTSIMGGGVGSNTSQTLTWDGPEEVEIVINDEVSSSAGVDLLLDFNVAQSVYENSNQYFIHPLVTVIRNASTGIQGEVHGSLMAAVMLSNGQHTYSTYIDAAGHFLIRGVDPGVYSLTIIPTEQGMQEQHIDNITIVQGQINQFGSVQMQ